MSLAGKLDMPFSNGIAAKICKIGAKETKFTHHIILSQWIGKEVYHTLHPAGRSWRSARMFNVTVNNLVVTGKLGGLQARSPSVSKC